MPTIYAFKIRPQGSDAANNAVVIGHSLSPGRS